MADRNVFQMLYAKVNQQNNSDIDNSDSKTSSGEEYVPSNTSDSEADVLEKDLRERIEEEGAGDSVEERSAQVGGDTRVNFTAQDGTVWQSTPPQRTRMKQHNTICSRAKPTNILVVITDILQAFR